MSVMPFFVLSVFDKDFKILLLARHCGLDPQSREQCEKFGGLRLGGRNDENILISTREDCYYEVVVVVDADVVFGVHGGEGGGEGYDAGDEV